MTVFSIDLDAVDEDKPNTNSIQNSISSNNTRLQDQTVDNIQETKAEKLHDKGCKLDATVKSCLEVQENSYDLGERKEEANNAYLMLGDNYQELKQHEEAIESYQKTLDISKELGDKEMQIIAIQRLGTLYLTLASVCSKECDYGQAVQWYKKVLDISGTERDEVHLLHEKALIGLGVAWLNLGDTEKAIEYIREAKRFAVKKADTGNHFNYNCFVENTNFTIWESFRYFK
jgi:tetratricopeptide (TPR) repeat protein